MSERHDKLRALADTAAKGPWEPITEACDCGGDIDCGHGDIGCGLRVGEQVTWPAKGAPVRPHHFEADEFADLTPDTLRFIAAARSAIPALLDEIAELRRGLGRVADRDPVTDADFDAAAASSHVDSRFNEIVDDSQTVAMATLARADEIAGGEHG